MTRSMSLPPLESSDLENSSTFNVVIAYEDLETGKIAKTTYDFLVENLGRDCRFINQMWKFDVLSIPKLREMAARDATQADIIIISSHGSDLPAEVRTWIELFLAEPNHAIALVALFDSPDAEATFQARSYLARVAERGEMEFFAQPDEWPGHHRAEKALDSPVQNPFARRTITTLTDAVHQDRSFPRWGINE